MTQAPNTLDAYTQLAKRLNGLSVRLYEFSKQLEPATSKELVRIQKKICDTSKDLVRLEKPVFLKPMKLTPHATGQFGLKIPAVARDLLGFTDNNLGVIVSVHGDNGVRWLVIKPQQPTHSI